MQTTEKEIKLYTEEKKVQLLSLFFPWNMLHIIRFCLYFIRTHSPHLTTITLSTHTARVRDGDSSGD